MIMIKDGLRYIKKLIESPTFKRLGVQLDVESIEPCKYSGSQWSDNWLECMARLHTDPQNHQRGTASIGRVVDSQLRVFGVSGFFFIKEFGRTMILAPEECGCPLVDEGISSVNSPVCSGTWLFMVLLDKIIRGRCDIATPCKNVRSEDHLQLAYDYIVIGAGSAGSIVAGRLSQDGKDEVLLMEAGGPAPTASRIPSFYRTFWSNKEVDWNYRTVPGNYCLDQNGKGCMWPRGKLLGGTSVLNGMMYCRARPADYADWVKAGAEGWSWEENLPFLDMTEGNKQIGSVVSAKYHSSSGPLPVQQFNYQSPEVYTLLAALNESGYPINSDLNDLDNPEGFVIAQAFNADGQRYTTARAYLKPKSEYPNLSVKLYAHVTKVIIRNNRAVGVEYLDNGVLRTVRARKEVILSAGALNSPHILLLSGIGPRETLEKFDIPVVADLPVGLNLINHFGATLYFVFTKLKNTRTLDWSALLSYLADKDGPMSSTGLTQVTGFLYSSLAKNPNQPDIQFFFNGLYAECSKTGEIGETVDLNCNNQQGYNISANTALLLPKSVGFLTLKSTNPLDPPIFHANYFDHPDDMIMVKDGLRYLQKVFESPTFKRLGAELDVESIELCKDSGAQWSDNWLECIARLHTDPQNHQQGTASIGRVVDSQLRVFGVSGLRVMDASVMPTLVTCNPQGAIMMVAEKGAYFIKNKDRDIRDKRRVNFSPRQFRMRG